MDFDTVTIPKFHNSRPAVDSHVQQPVRDDSGHYLNARMAHSPKFVCTPGGVHFSLRHLGQDFPLKLLVRTLLNEGTRFGTPKSKKGTCHQRGR